MPMPRMQTGKHPLLTARVPRSQHLPAPDQLPGMTAQEILALLDPGAFGAHRVLAQKLGATNREDGRARQARLAVGDELAKLDRIDGSFRS